MASDQSFAAFELAGWENEATTAAYDRHLSLVTTQSVEALLDDAGIVERSRVLDVATGAGYGAAAAARRGARPIGIDFSGAQVCLAQERYPSLRFEQANAEALPYESSSFDAVVNAFGLNFFLFSTAEQSSKALRSAGFDAPTFRQVPQIWRVADLDQVFVMLAAGTVRAAAMLRAQSSLARQAIRDAMRQVLSDYQRGSEYEVPMPAVVATAVKP